MSQPRFLTVEQIEQLHRVLIEKFGGSHGYRDKALFEGAAMHPQTVFHYTGGDLFDLAAAYAFHLAEAQAFLDGNKRTGLAAALSFLSLNNARVPENTDRLYEAMIAISAKRMDKAQLAALFRQLAATG